MHQSLKSHGGCVDALSSFTEKMSRVLPEIEDAMSTANDATDDTAVGTGTQPLSSSTDSADLPLKESSSERLIDNDDFQAETLLHELKKKRTATKSILLTVVAVRGSAAPLSCSCSCSK